MILDFDEAGDGGLVGAGTSQAMCKSCALRSRQIAMLTSHHRLGVLAGVQLVVSHH